METAESTLARLVEQRLKALNTNPFAFEVANGLPEDAVRSILRGGKKSGTSINRAQAICAALGLDFRIGEARAPEPEPVVLDPDAYAQVPVHNAWLAAGSGRLNGDAEIIGHLAFRRDWLTKIGISPGHARVARAKGDSMAPGIGSGDLVLIDTAKTLADVPIRSAKDRRSSPVFAFIQDGEARIKRLQHPAGRSLLIISDNPAYEPEVIDPADRDFEILGQVVWSGHVWR